MTRFRIQHAVLFLAAATACQGADNGEGEGGSEPAQDIGMLDTPNPVVGPGSSIPNGLEFNRSEFRVQRDLTLLMSLSYRVGDLLLFGGIAEARRDTIVAFDYGTGVARELYVASNEGRFVAPLSIMLDGQRLFTSTIASDTEDTRVFELDVESGAVLSQSDVPSLWGQCQAVAGGDYYFDWMDDFLVAGGLTTTGPVDDVTAIAAIEDFCPSAGLGSLDGSLVVLDGPTEFDPAPDMFELWAVEGGAREGSPLVSVRVDDVSLGVAGERAPVVALAEDGLYVLASDFVAIEIWFVPYDRRPGSSGVVDDPQAPTLVTRIEIPFFGEVVPFEGAVLSFERIHGLAAVDGVLALPLRLLEENGSQRFFWNALVMLDTESSRVDLFNFGDRLEGFGMVRSPEP